MGTLDGKLTQAIKKAMAVADTEVYLRWFQDTSYNTSTLKRTETDKANSPHTARLVWWSPNSQQLRTDGVVRPGDRMALLNNDSLPHTPIKGMVVEFADPDSTSNPNHQWLVVQVDPISTGDEDAAYQLVLRQ